jgi:ABC-type glycerol-3-phosphate transport system substrate-binding protein
MAPSRRRVLRLAGLSAAGLAGCLGDTGTPTAEHTPTARSTPVHTPTASPTETPTDSPTDDRETRTAVDCEDGQSPSG